MLTALYVGQPFYTNPFLRYLHSFHLILTEAIKIGIMSPLLLKNLRLRRFILFLSFAK